MSDPPSQKERSGVDPDLSGQKLGNYQLLRRLGRGGMADVYLAEQLSLRRQVAFKVLKRSLAEDQAYVRRFHNEARAAASLVHANIVQIHEVGCIDGIHFIAQEYVAGQNLKQWLARQGMADAKTAVHIMRQVIAALRRASQQGIIHRDIKPENIMLAKTGEVKVADFGLARVTSDGQAVDLTQVGVTMGTPLYMSPEQVEGRAVDPRSDLYSFGVTSFEMLTGRPPFEGDTPLSVAVQHLKSEPERLENLRPDLPEGLCRIVHRLLAKSAAERFQTPAEVMRDLRALQIEGLEEWPAGMDDWDAPELLAFSQGRSQATMRLESVMKSHAVVARRRMLGGWIGAALLGGLLLGGTGAALNRPAYLLEVTGETVEKKETVQLQYWHALKLNTEEAWLAVERYFAPEEKEAESKVRRVYAWQAKQRLAEFYRENHQPEKAMQLYSELAASDEIQFAAQGLVGKANLLFAQGKKESATAELGAAATLLAQLPQAEQIRSVLQWLDPDLRGAFLEVAKDVDRLEELSPDLMFE
ncbi:MAG: serine/threonine-protein kinase [Pirellulaceae bacterium]